MKTIKIFAILAMAATLALGITGCGCSRDKQTQGPVEYRTLVLKLNNVKVAGGVSTQSVEASGQDNVTPTIDPERSFIYIYSVNNTVGGDLRTVAMTVASGTQVIESVPTDAVVYAVANVPAADVANFTGLATIDAVKALTADLDTQFQQYDMPAMASVDTERNAEAVGVTEEADGSLTATPIRLLP